MGTSCHRKSNFAKTVPGFVFYCSFCTTKILLSFIVASFARNHVAADVVVVGVEFEHLDS